MAIKPSILNASLLLTAIAVASPGQAAVTVVTAISGPSSTSATDLSFEGAGGFLQSYYGLPLVSGTALPPIERAVGQVKVGNNKRRGLYVPTGASGLPAPDGTGVISALTNFSPLAGGSDTNFVSGTPVAFSISRTGTTVSYTVGSDTWSETKGYYADVTGFEIRVRANEATSATPSDSHDLTDLLFNDAATVNQSLGAVSAANDQVSIKLWDGVSGDFSITGNYVFNWSGNQPSGARLASQIKLLALPAAPGVPEPTSWALMIGGFGLVGAAARRQRRAAFAA